MPQPASKRLLTEANAGFHAADPATPLGAALSTAFGPTATPMKAKFAGKRGNTIVLFGHSIVEYNESTTVAGPPPEHNVRSDGWFRWLNVFLRQRFTLLGVEGYAGYTVAQLKAVTGPAKASGASYVMFQGVINSLTQDVSATAIIADLDIIVQDFLDNGQTFILCTEWPATTLTTTAQKDAHEAVNRWILAQSTRPGVIVIPWHQVMTDVTTGNPKTSALSDGTHPLTFGAMTAARAAFNILDPIIPRLGDGALISSNASQNNAVTNGMMLGTAGTKSGAGITGTVADGWQLEAANASHVAVGSKVARADGFGEWQQIQITGGSGSANGGTLLTRTPNLPAGWAVGDKVFAEFEFETDADFANATTLELILWGLTAGSVTNQTEWTLRNSNGTTDIKRLGSISGVVRTDPMTILTGTTKIQFRLMLNKLNDASTATIRIGRVRLGRVL